MNAMAPQGFDEGDWTSVDTCTLPTAERPWRLAEFDDLFASSLRTIERSGATHARLLLAGDEMLADRTQRLADAESSCCSFFTFHVETVEPADAAAAGVVLEVEVPDAYVDVLAGLVARADAVRDNRRDAGS